MSLAYWVHDLSPFLIQFTDSIGIRYYGLAYVLGFVGGWWFLSQAARAGRSPLNEKQIGDVMVALVLGVVLGGRLGYFILYHPATFWEAPLDLFKVWGGGMSFHGGLLGVVIALVAYARSQRIPFLMVGDLAAVIAPLGLLLGRLANFINGELWGKPTDVAWAVIFPSGGPTPRHPSQLYEAALEGLLLLVWLQLRFWRAAPGSLRPGRLGGEFLIGYGISRVICEVFREPDEGVSPLLFDLSRGTFYSIFLIAAGLVLILRARRAKG